MTTDSINFKIDAESKKVMIKELAIINGLKLSNLLCKQFFLVN